jgi:hypothetical protein
VLFAPVISPARFGTESDAKSDGASFSLPRSESFMSSETASRMIHRVELEYACLLPQRDWEDKERLRREIYRSPPSSEEGLIEKEDV